MNKYDGLLPNEPILMPYQAFPLNGDHFACEEFIKLRDKHKIDTIIELGSCVMGSTRWFSEQFERVKTVEISPEFRNIGLQRISDKKNVESWLGDSVGFLGPALKKCTDKTLIYIDSHWLTLPLIDELEKIAESGLKPCIVVHDCYVPEFPQMGYDEYDGVRISYATMRNSLIQIYGDGGYVYHYNTPETSTEVKRGIIYIQPVSKK